MLTAFSNNNKWGFKNDDDLIVILCQFDDIVPYESYEWPESKNPLKGFVEGLAGVVINNKCGIINEKGEFIIPCEYDEILSWKWWDICFPVNTSYILIKKNNLTGMIDINGNFIASCKYHDWALDYNKNIRLLLNKTWTVFDKESNSYKMSKGDHY